MQANESLGGDRCPIERDGPQVRVGRESSRGSGATDQIGGPMQASQHNAAEGYVGYSQDHWEIPSTNPCQQVAVTAAGRSYRKARQTATPRSYGIRK